MKAVLKQREGAGGLEWADWPEPELRPGHVIVEIHKAGICSTDVAIYDGSYRGRHPLSYPSMIGHEAAGTVAAAAADVDDVAVGERVSLQVIWGRPHSWQSILGEENLDPDWLHIGASALGGAFAERIAIPATRVIRLPDIVGWEQGALLEPLAVASHAMELVHLQPGETFTVVGPGQFGLLMIQIAKASGAASITAVGLEGVDETRLEAARLLGADTTITHAGDTADTAAQILAATGGGAEVVMDCGGTPDSPSLALDAAAPGGRVAIFGFTREARIEPLRQIIRKGLSLHGVSAAKRRHYGIALRLIQTGTVDPVEIVSHRLPMRQAADGIELVKSREASKVLLEP